MREREIWYEIKRDIVCSVCAIHVDMCSSRILIMSNFVRFSSSFSLSFSFRHTFYLLLYFLCVSSLCPSFSSPSSPSVSSMSLPLLIPVPVPSLLIPLPSSLLTHFIPFIRALWRVRGWIHILLIAVSS